MPKPEYTYESKTVNYTASGQFKLLVNGNRNRMVLTVSCGDLAVQSIMFLTIGNNQSNVFYYIENPGTVILAYRDFGPVIREEIWCHVQTTGAPIDVTAFSVCVVPR